MNVPESDVGARRRALFATIRGAGAEDPAADADDVAAGTDNPATSAESAAAAAEGPASSAEGPAASADNPQESDVGAPSAPISGAGPPDTTTEPAPVGDAPADPTPADAEDAPAPLADVASADAGEALGLTPELDPNSRHPAADLPLPRVLAIANQKGGVGKTTTAVNLSAALAELGYRVLAVDLDPQGNATTGLGINARNLESSIYDVLMHELPLEECIEPTAVRNLFVAPATIDLAGAEIELVPAFSRELKLRRALADQGEEFDFIVIDCPPSLGLLTINGLAAATEVVVPIQCEYYALEGVGQLMRNVALVQGNLNPRLILSAVILTMYDARTKLSEQVMAEVRDHFGPRVCRNIVPRTVRLSEAPSFGQPIIVFDSASRGALAYRELAKEVSGGPSERLG